MKQAVDVGYTFVPGPSGKGTIDLGGIPNFTLANLYSIVNQTAGRVIFDAESNRLGIESISGSVLTLRANTIGQQPTDILMIVYDEPITVTTSEGVVGTQPVSASSLPLPSGASTSALQNMLLTGINTLLKQGQTIEIGNLPATQPISVDDLPLPDGAATEASLALILAALGSLMPATGGSVGISSLPAGIATVTGQQAILTALSSLLQTGGTVNVGNLPADTATATLQHSIITAINTVLKPGGTIEVGNFPTGGATDASLQEILTTLGTPAQAGGAVSVSNLPSDTATATLQHSILTAIGNVLQPGGAVSVSNFPTGQATAALQNSILTALQGLLQAGGTVSVSNFPTGGATNTLQQSILTAIENLVQANGNVNVGNLPVDGSTATLQHSILTALAGLVQAGGTVNVGNLPSTQAISAAALPLPTGAATDAKLNLILTALGNLVQANGAVSVSNFPAGLATAAGQTTIATALAGLLPAGGTVEVGNFPTNNAQESGGNLDALLAGQGADGTSITPPTGGSGVRGWLSGIYKLLSNPIAVVGTFWPATQPISATNLPLPSGAATAAGQANIVAAVNALATTGEVVSVSNFPSTQPVSASALPLPSNAAQETGGNLAALVTAQGTDGTGITAPLGGVGVRGWLSGIYKAVTGTVAVSASTLPLPTGAAQESGGNLATIAAAQGTIGTGDAPPAGGSGILGYLSGIYKAITSPIAVTGTFWQATQPVSAASLPLPTGAATTTDIASVVAALGTPLQASGTVNVGNLPSTQPVSVLVLPLPSNAAQETGGNLAAMVSNQGTSGTGITPPVGGSGKLGWMSGVYQALTGTLSVSAASLPLPTGAATVTGQAAIVTALGTPLQAGGAVSVSNFPVSQPISASALPLPTGAAQETGGNLAALVAARGTDATAATPPAGATGVRGWLSGIYTLLTNPLAVTGTFWQATQPISASALPLPTGAAKEAGGNLATIVTNQGTDATAATPPAGATGTRGWLSGIYQLLAGTLTTNVAALPLTAATVTATGNAAYLPVRNLPSQRWKPTFSQAIASGVSSVYFTTVKTGSGQSINQSANALNLVAGTTAYSETILRSTTTFQDALFLKYLMSASQRIANNNFYIELVDLIGDGLAYTINSATSITVTLASTTLPDGSTIGTGNVGQSMYIGGLTSATSLGGRYVIAAVSGLAVTFTVAGFPASGSGTCSLFGWNYQQVIYNGTTNTADTWDTQAYGYAFGATACTINATAAPGHVGILTQQDNFATYQDVVTTSIGGVPTVRASRVQNIPAASIPLYLQIRSLNGSTAPATTTTFTVGFVSIEPVTAIDVNLNNVKPQGVQGALDVIVSSMPAASGVNLSQIGGVSPSTATGNGSALKALGAAVTTATSQIDQSATAYAGSGRVNGTVVASTVGGGAVISAEVNVTALTLGTATAVFAILQESTGGTNFTDIWVSDPITTTGIVRVPAIPIAGRRRWAFFSAGGTSTTVTVTITSLELPPGGYPLTRQFRDYFAATNPLSTVINTAVQTASNFALASAGTATTVFNVEGCKTISAFMLLAGGPTVTQQPVVSLQLSMDGTNWFTVTGVTMSGNGNGLYMTSLNTYTAKYARLTVSTAATYSAGSYTVSNIGINAVN